MTTYSPTNAAEIITAINTSAGNGDVVVLPSGTWDCTAATLSPAAGVTIRGSGRDVCVVKALWDCDLNGSANALTLEDFELNVAGLTGAGTGQPMVWDHGTYIGRRIRAKGPNGGSYITMFWINSYGGPTKSYWYDCEFTDSAGDIFSCSGDNAYGPDSETHLYNPRIWKTPDGGSSTQCLTTHNDHTVYVYGGFIDDSSRTDNQGAVVNGAGAAGYAYTHLYGTKIIGAVRNGVHCYGCEITGRTGLTSLISNSNLVTGCRVHATGISSWCVTKTESVETTRIENSWLSLSGGSATRGFSTLLTCDAQITIVNCRFSGFTRGLQLDHTAGYTPTITLSNNVFDGCTYYVYDSGAHSVSWLGGSNSFAGSQQGSSYTLQTGDALETGAFDVSGRPTGDGNLDGTADATAVMTLRKDCFGKQREWLDGRLCRGPSDVDGGIEYVYLEAGGLRYPVAVAV